MLILKLAARLKTSSYLILILGLSPPGGFAASFTETVFATGTPFNATQPNSVTYGNGSVWVTYANNAPTQRYSGAGTIVQYDLAGGVQNTYSLAGSLGGLKFNPNTGQLWVLQGQDAFSQLSIINPASKTISSYAFADPKDYLQGFDIALDDVAFVGKNVFMNQTHTASAIVELVNPNPAGPIAVTTALNRGTLLATDPRALNSTPDGGLILTGRLDQALTFVINPGQPNQTARSLKMTAAPGTSMGYPGDALYAGAASGTFYLTDSGTNIVYRLAATGLDPDTLFVDAGTEFGIVDADSGVVTPLFYGSNIDSMTFVPDSAAVPEPSAFGLSVTGIALSMLRILRFSRVASSESDRSGSGSEEAPC